MENCPLNGKPCSNPKKITITNIVDGVPTHAQACDCCCASKMAIHPPTVNGLVEIIDRIFRSHLQMKCDSCGSTQESIMTASRFGCASCVDKFRTLALRYLDRCQVGLKHIGKRPRFWVPDETSKDTCDRIRLLEEKMKNAVQIENYEIAGVLKRKIEELTKEAK